MYQGKNCKQKVKRQCSLNFVNFELILKFFKNQVDRENSIESTGIVDCALVHIVKRLLAKYMGSCKDSGLTHSSMVFHHLP